MRVEQHRQCDQRSLHIVYTLFGDGRSHNWVKELCTLLRKERARARKETRVNSCRRESIIRVIGKCRDLGILIIFISVIYSTKGLSGGKWYAPKLPNVLNTYDEGNPMRDFAEGIISRKDEVIVYKQYSSSFLGTSLSSLLVSMGIDTTLICGYSTSGCVRATTLDAMQHGFSPYVVREACGDRHEAVSDSNLSDMDQRLAEVRTEEWTLKHLDASFGEQK
ncbi:Isochorismatase hydrolase [Pleomassaria siparia CBS 279.74]|uniref:Isochorismatase hydrolase n=1 Tax=Pleomassaria siparia CBS 279.74 TaxID=1314801 RepID=A0A6G1K0V0_9PLEO|nr:Isochorismatase hydrolase [Pleomassaria siparia CBS 279.74]